MTDPNSNKNGAHGPGSRAQRTISEIVAACTVTGYEGGCNPQDVKNLRKVSNAIWDAQGYGKKQRKWFTIGAIATAGVVLAIAIGPEDIVICVLWTCSRIAAGAAAALNASYGQGDGEIPAGAGTVWDDIKGTQPAIAGTGGLPKSFELTAGGTRVWVHPNVTKHIAQNAIELKKRGASPEMIGLSTQQQLRSLQQAVADATSGGVPLNEPFTIDGWQLEFRQRSGDPMPALTNKKLS